VVIAGIYEAFSSAFVRRRLSVAGGKSWGGEPKIAGAEEDEQCVSKVGNKR
jgi:hypothetical protein